MHQMIARRDVLLRARLVRRHAAVEPVVGVADVARVVREVQRARARPRAEQGLRFGRVRDAHVAEEGEPQRRRVAERRQTMLIVTHEMQFAREIADRVLFMHGGKIVEAGPREQIFSAPKDERLQRFLSRLSR